MPERNSFETVLKWIVLVILAIVAIKVAISVLGLAFFLGGFLLFKILPLVLLVWVALKLVEWFRGKNGGSTTEPDLGS